MKIAGNQVRHLADYYHRELDEIFGAGETEALFTTAIEHYLKIERSRLQAKLNDNVNQSDLLEIYDCCKELKTGRPLQYILKEAWFYGLKFYVDERVLIPRPETEELVEMILKENGGAARLLDIGTGSGCIPLAIKKNSEKCEVTGCDISSSALEVAKKNASFLNLQANWVLADVLDEKNFSAELKGSFDVIVSNPPYIKKEEKFLLHQNVLAHEPHLALFVDGTDDIVFYRRIIDHCGKLLNKDGRLYFELNPLTAEKVKNYANSKNYFNEVELREDMSGKIRFLRAQKKP